MKALTILLILLLLLPAASALESSRVFIVGMTYSDGQLFVNDQLVKFGYAPDRKIQPAAGIQAEIISDKGDVLYLFTFDIPDSEFTDAGQDNSTITGGLVRHSSTDFSLVMPYFEEAKEIVFLDQSGLELVAVEAEHPIEDIRSAELLALSLAFMALAIILLIAISRKRKKR